MVGGGWKEGSRAALGKFALGKGIGWRSFGFAQDDRRRCIKMGFLGCARNKSVEKACRQAFRAQPKNLY